MGESVPQAKQDILILWGLEGFNERAFEYYPCLWKVKEYVEKHLPEELPLKVAAAIACMEAKYFSTFFHKKVGLTYIQWVSHLRVAKAIALIQSTNHPVTYVAHETGFNDLRTFERAFKRCTRLTAQKFKQSVL